MIRRKAKTVSLKSLNAEEGTQGRGGRVHEEVAQRALGGTTCLTLLV